MKLFVGENRNERRGKTAGLLRKHHQENNIYLHPLIKLFIPKSNVMRKILLTLIVAIISQVVTIHQASATTLVVPNSYILPANGDPDPAKVKAAIEEFKNLSRHEKKVMMKEMKQTIRDFKKEKKAGNEGSTNTVLLVILAILIPPLAVYLHEGVINKRFWIDLILTLLFYLPGMIYALVVVLSKD